MKRATIPQNTNDSHPKRTKMEMEVDGNENNIAINNGRPPSGKRNKNDVRYDRQIRLWGDEGQNSISGTKVCILGSNTLATEVLKNLVLAGIKSFHIKDHAVVTDVDLGQNFFVTEVDLGKPRAEVAVKLLEELNPGVSGSFEQLKQDHWHITKGVGWKDEELEPFLDYSIVIDTVGDSAIHNYLYTKRPIIEARTAGFMGYINIQANEHTIWNNHEENPVPDLRLDTPFPELKAYVDSIDLSNLTHEQHAHTPYVVLYFKALEKWRSQQNSSNTLAGSDDFPDNYKKRKEFEKVFLGMRMPDDKGSLDEENFFEGKRAITRSFVRTQIPPNVTEVLDDPRASLAELKQAENGAKKAVDKAVLQEYLTKDNANTFWIFVAALKYFVFTHNCLPLSGQLPDMTSDSKSYTTLLDIYRNKAKKDAREVYFYAQNIMKKLGLDGEKNGHALTFTQCQNFCKFAAFIGLQKGTAELKEKKRESDLSNYQDPRIDEWCEKLEKVLDRITQSEYYPAKFYPPNEQKKPEIEPLVWYALWLAREYYQTIVPRIPGSIGHLDQEGEALKKALHDLVEKTGNEELYNNLDLLIPNEAYTEMARFADTELNPMASIIGATAAQEAIKLVTHQYIPLDNLLIFDGHTQMATKIRL